MTFMVASMPDFKNKLTQDWESVRRFMNNISLVIIIAIASIHFSTLDEEYQLMEAEVPPKDISMNFYLNASEMFPESEWVISFLNKPEAHYILSGYFEGTSWQTNFLEKRRPNLHSRPLAVKRSPSLTSMGSGRSSSSMPRTALLLANEVA